MNVEIKDLVVSVNEKIILDNLNLNIKKGETHVIMGPNGTGKSTLSKVIMGDINYQINSGDIICDNTSIKDLTPDLRAKLGIFLSFQNPIEIEGISNSEFLRSAISNKNDSLISIYDFVKIMDKAMEDLDFNKNMLHRSINQNFSGGERKKNEILQMKVLKPKFLILDELDSGLDIDSLKLICKNINEYKEEYKDTSILIITHYPRILEYLTPDYVHILNKGKIIKTGDYNLAKDIDVNGYKNYISGLL